MLEEYKAGMHILHILHILHIIHNSMLYIFCIFNIYSAYSVSQNAKDEKLYAEKCEEKYAEKYAEKHAEYVYLCQKIWKKGTICKICKKNMQKKYAGEQKMRNM